MADELKLYSVPDEVQPVTAEDVQALITSNFQNQNQGQQKLVAGNFQSANFVTGTQGWQLKPNGDFEGNTGTFRGDLIIGGLSRTIGSTSNIQTALDALNTAGGGTLYLKAGTWTLSSSLTGYSSVAIVGISTGSTIIDFNSTASSLNYIGTAVYSTGTITAASGVNITGSGTLWLANVSAGQYLFLGTRWYLIAAVTGNTTLVLAESYGDNVTLPSTYRVSAIKHDIFIKGLTVKNSTATGIVATDARKIVMEDVDLLQNNKGWVFTNVSLCPMKRVQALASTSNGYELTNVGLFDNENTNAFGNGAHGAVFNNVKTGTFFACASDTNTTNGYNITTGVDLTMYVEASSNGGKGIEQVSGCDSIIIYDSPVRSNTSDGIKFTATATNCRIYGSSITSNGGYGVNIANANCTTNILTTNVFSGNSTSACNDTGTSTIIRGNSGLTDNSSGNLSVNKFGGTGADGALTVSSGNTNVDCANAMIVVKNYTSVSITGTGSVTFTNPHANGTIILLRATGDITLTSSAAPMLDASGMGGVGGTAGATSNTSGSTAADTNTFFTFVTHGGTAGLNVPTQGSGGALPTAIAPATPFASTSIPILKYGIDFWVGSGGGGGGTANSSNNATQGTGGRGGGGLIIECAGSWNFTTASGISVAGKVGGNPTNTTFGGAGGGGAGGFIYALYNTLTANSGTVNVAGGAGGSTVNNSTAGGGGGSTAYTAGSSGSNGNGGTGASGSSVVTANTLFV